MDHLAIHLLVGLLLLTDNPNKLPDHSYVSP